MNPASKKNLQESEVILYKPKPHWIIVVWPFIQLSFSFFAYRILLPFPGIIIVFGLFLGVFVGLITKIISWVFTGILGMAIGGILGSFEIVIKWLESWNLIGIDWILPAIFYPFVGSGGIRFIGILIEFFLTEYYITNKRLIFKKAKLFAKGFFLTLVRDIPIEKIESINYDQTLLGKLLNYGTLQITGIGGESFEYYLIMRPMRARRKIYEVMEKNRKITVIRNNSPKPITMIKEKIVDIDYGTFVSSFPKEEK